MRINGPKKTGFGEGTDADQREDSDTTTSKGEMNTHEASMIEITLQTTIRGEERNGGTRTDRGTRINREIIITDVVTTIGKTCAATWTRSIDVAQTLTRHCQKAV